MIYLIVGTNNVVTDSTLTYIPEKIDVTLDDVLLGEYTNLSTKQRYINIELPIEEITEQNEHTLKFYVAGALFKTELAVVSKQNNINFSTITNSNKKIISYER